MHIFKQNSYNPKIFPFYPKKNLQSDENFKVYKTYLDKIFKDKEIKNIAVTGNFGVGKSSILHSYDIIRNSKFYKIRKKSKFLYISLADFSTTEISASKNKKNDKRNKINSLESNLIYQILARCKEKDIPESNCEKYFERRHWLVFYPLLITTIISIILILFFKEEFQFVLSELFDVANETTANIYAYLYLILELIIIVFSFLLFKKIIQKVQLRSINIKTNYADVDVGVKSYNTYIDCKKIELVYVLTQISRKINYTVVFEDMDRLDKHICIEIFSKLRDINTLINIRLKNKRTPIKFIYVANDEIFDVENRTKFFDYILPIIPPVNKLNSKKILKLGLESVGINNINDRLIDIISDVLYDYRKINSVLNEYQLFRDVNINNSFSSGKYMNLNKCEIFAFVVYKVLCPQDYSKIRIGESNLLKLFINDQVDIGDDKYSDLVKYFVHSEVLTERVLELLGNSDDYIKKCYLKKLNSKNDSEKINAVTYLLNERIVSTDIKKIFNKNYYWKQNNIEFQALLLCYLITNKIDLCDWFFQISKSSKFEIYQKTFDILLNVPYKYLNTLMSIQGNAIKNNIIVCLKKIVLSDAGVLPSESFLWQKISILLGQEPISEIAIGNYPIIVDGERKTINDEIMKYI